MVDRIRVGERGYALLVDQNGRLIAHGNPDQKRHIADTEQTHTASQLRFAATFRQTRIADDSYVDEDTREPMLAVAAEVGDPLPQWTVIVERPRAEALATAIGIERQLFAAIMLALTGTIILGWAWGRSFIQRIFALTRVTRAIAEGKLETRVALSGQDEIRELGDAFNSMADRLVELQEDIRKQERQVMFGRIAAGLVHDLSHPIQNIGNSCKLILKMWEDA